MLHLLIAVSETFSFCMKKLKIKTSLLPPLSICNNFFYWRMTKTLRLYWFLFASFQIWLNELCEAKDLCVWNNFLCILQTSYEFTVSSDAREGLILGVTNAFDGDQHPSLSYHLDSSDVMKIDQRSGNKNWLLTFSDPRQNCLITIRIYNCG